MQSININTAKIDKSALYEGKQGKYLSLTLIENRDGQDQYGNDGFVVQDLGKDRRQAGEKGPIIGNWKHVGQSAPKGRDRTPADGYRAGSSAAPRDNGGGSASYDEESDIPFRPHTPPLGF